MTACPKTPYVTRHQWLLALRAIQRQQDGTLYVPSGAYLCPLCRSIWRRPPRRESRCRPGFDRGPPVPRPALPELTSWPSARSVLDMVQRHSAAREWGRLQRYVPDGTTEPE